MTTGGKAGAGRKVIDLRSGDAFMDLRKIFSIQSESHLCRIELLPVRIVFLLTEHQRKLAFVKLDGGFGVFEVHDPVLLDHLEAGLVLGRTEASK